MKRKNPAAVALGRRGGKARAAKLTAEQRSENARKAGLTGGKGRPKKALPIIVTKEDVAAMGMPAIKKHIQKTFGKI